MPPVIEARGITKRFPGVVANDNVNFTLEQGEIHALLGENGAGKSTLMNIIYSLYQPDEGEILVNGEPAEFHSPTDAINRGIGMVHQHFMLVPVMTVTENSMLGLEETVGSRRISAVVGGILAVTLGFMIGGGGAALSSPEVGLSVWGFIGAVVGAAFAAAMIFLDLPSRMSSSVGRNLIGPLAGVGFGLGYYVLTDLILGAQGGLLNWLLTGATVGFFTNLRWIDKQEVAQRVKRLSDDYGLAVDPYATIQDMPVGAQQRVEIIKALYRDARVLILDEPTAVLTPQEADDLFDVMRRLRDSGVSIIFISHKLREVLDIADRITVLRRGQVVGSAVPENATRESLARMMLSLIHI
ncbi:MAG: ATP-binding cassette domain-containing protein [Chloroflexi bacterium]|nr:ATP-binding cassette domain-containing protein [Chloroflexota bacterium]